jgi:uncharacterized circularly permuted ATP-grasp superfamily protein
MDAAYRPPGGVYDEAVAPDGRVRPELSSHQTVIDGGLAPRHLDLRPFVFLTREGACVLPGGLTRVAFEEGALIVNSSQNGGAKDTWVPNIKGV